ncbi:hypothetical protein SynRS9907_02017 [Synechococcus sp. RS9907]|nr:hypothetical protein SynRS9907_02017 [Synechococcus sp. RS9907]
MNGLIKRQGPPLRWRCCGSSGSCCSALALDLNRVAEP